MNATKLDTFASDVLALQADIRRASIVAIVCSALAVGLSILLADFFEGIS